MDISEEFKKRLITEGINPLNVVTITTVNDKYQKKIITTVTLIDDTEHKLVDNYIWYASRKNKRW